MFCRQNSSLQTSVHCPAGRGDGVGERSSMLSVEQLVLGGGSHHIDEAVNRLNQRSVAIRKDDWRRPAEPPLEGGDRTRTDKECRVAQRLVRSDFTWNRRAGLSADGAHRLGYRHACCRFCDCSGRFLPAILICLLQVDSCAGFVQFLARKRRADVPLSVEIVMLGDTTGPLPCSPSIEIPARVRDF